MIDFYFKFKFLNDTKYHYTCLYDALETPRGLVNDIDWETLEICSKEEYDSRGDET